MALPFFGQDTIKFLTIWLGSIMVATFTLFYTLHSGAEFIELGVPQLPTISYTGALFPGTILLTAGLHLGSIFVAYVYMAVYVAFEEKFNKITENEVVAKHDLFIEYYMVYCCCNPSTTSVAKLRKWNKVLLYMGLFTAFTLWLVGSVTLTTAPAVHGTLAFLMFISAIVHMFLFYLLVRRFVDMKPNIKVMHRIACASCFPVPILMFIVAGIVYVNCQSYDCRILVVDAGPVSEFINVLGLGVYAYSFHEEIASTSLLIVNCKADEVLKRYASVAQVAAGEKMGAGAGVIGESLNSTHVILNVDADDVEKASTTTNIV